MLFNIQKNQKNIKKGLTVLISHAMLRKNREKLDKGKYNDREQNIRPKC